MKARPSGQPTLTAAVIGGGLGGRLSLDALIASDAFAPIAIADSSAAVRDELALHYPELSTYERHEQLLEAVSPDVICVSTYPPSHEEVALAAVATAPRGMLVEKPLGPTAAAGARIIGAVREAAIPIVVPHGLLVQATAREVIDRVRTGDIGAIEIIEIRTTGWDIINAGIHWLNLCIELLVPDPLAQALARCDTSTRTYRDGMQVETTAVTYLESASGVRILMVSGDNVNMPDGGAAAHFKIIGTLGAIDFHGFEEGYRIRSPRHPFGFRVDVTPLPGTNHQRHLENLASEIHSGSHDYTLAERSLAALGACEAAYLSNRLGCQITLPLVGLSAPERTNWDPGSPYRGTGGGRDGRHL